ncbi:MAG: pyruvate, phosphate dikinase [Myxococcales bacterium]|nr:pyruvate, phosphate dikinase [Myxococcales bacterium]
MEQIAWFFGNGEADGDGSMKASLGGKGAGLAEMTRAGLPVPPGFTLTTESCFAFFDAGQRCPDAIDTAMRTALAKLEKVHGRYLGARKRPLLLSVRSGASISMPGMMDTVLNLGLNDVTAAALEAESGNTWYARDCYRRFLQMFGDVVLEVPAARFSARLEAMKAQAGVQSDTDLSAHDLRVLVADFKEIIREVTGSPFPQDALTQLRMARDAVFRSWFNVRAKAYRSIHHISEQLGTAVNVQAMVFGNNGWRSGSGVGFTRDPSTGDNKLYGEYLLNAQGEDVVAGTRTPQPLAQLETDMPKVHKQLAEIAATLESHYKDVQDFEFTIEDDKLFMLQTRAGKRTGQAAIRIACDLHEEGVIDAAGAVMLVQPEHIEQLLHQVFIPGQQRTVLAKGLPASPGAATGRLAFTSEDAVTRSGGDDPVILVRVETSPEDIAGMHVAAGILTARGGMTSHAAVVARQMGTCCIAGCDQAHVDVVAETLEVGGRKLQAGDWLSLDGTSGEVIAGRLQLRDPDLGGPYFDRFMGLVDQFRSLGVRTNADQPEDVRRAREFGAEGVGLCRTEHMFFDPDRLPVVQHMIMSVDNLAREAALAELLPFQRADFEAIFEAMDGLPCTIRLLDPPLHEFLPRRQDLLSEVASLERGMRHRDNVLTFLELNDASEETLAGVREAMERAEDNLAGRRALLRRAETLHEQNPMLGHRGCRLGISFPGITRMQTRAIVEAALNVRAKGIDPVPEIMIPLVGSVAELQHQRAVVEKEAEQVFAERGERIDLAIGTMIELPRACVVAGEIAEAADFFSFGTNDLTQTTFGFSRDDAGGFTADYKRLGVFDEDPFAHLDQKGVGALVEHAVKQGRTTKEALKIGICGEHGGDPKSIAFCMAAGLDYVSCSPFRVPVARIAAAQASIALQNQG